MAAETRPIRSDAVARPTGQPHRRPAKDARAPWGFDRQGRLVAGVVIALSVLGSLALPGLQWLAVAIGAVLILGAVTNTCIMGRIVAALPCNQRGCRVDPGPSQHGQHPAGPQV